MSNTHASVDPTVEATVQALRQALSAVSMPTGAIVWNADRTVRFTNRRAVEIAGRSIAEGSDATSMIAASRLHVADSGDLYPVELLIPASVFEGATAEVRGAEFELPDGARRSVEGWTAPVHNDSGAVVLAVTVFADVSERRRSESLRDGEARVLEMVAADRPLLETLDALARLIEAHAEGMLASILLVENRSRVQHAAAPSLPEAWAALVNGEPIGPNRGSCGTAAYLKEPVIVSDIATDPRWTLYREAALQFNLRACWSTPIIEPGGEVLGTFAFYYTQPRNPTDRLLRLAAHASRLATVAIQHHRHQEALGRQHQMEEELRQLRVRDQLHAILETAPSSVGIVTDGRVRYMNARFRDTFGLEIGDAPQPRYVDIRDRERILADLADGQPVIDRELQMYAANGQILDLLVTYRPIEYEGKTSLLAYLVDVTGVKDAERTLRRAKEAAEAATRAKSLFLANMSHEIRTPLNAILGYAQLLQRDATLSTAQQHRISVIHGSGSHLLMVINDILEMSRIEAGRTILILEPFDLRALLDDVRLMFTELAGAKNLELTLAIDRECPRTVHGDAGKVRQVIVNLLSNATKFTDKGRIAIRASAAPLTTDAYRVTIAVEDTGPGIETGDLERIFEAFDQSASGARHSGTGLGLAISRHFARLMEGDLTVTSGVGRGSVFTFTFDAGVAADPAVNADVESVVPVGLHPDQERPRVLIVDDVATNRELLEELLSRTGFETRMSASGEEALVMHREWLPQFVLMDIRMSGMNGLDAIQRLRAEGSQATIIALTASGVAETEQEAIAAGATAFLRKPYREADLLSRMAETRGLKYVYATDLNPSTTIARSPGAADPLAGVLRDVPADLRGLLREAALEGRARRLERLAAQIEPHSEAAATRVRALAGTFDYDALLAALDHGESQ